MTLGLDTSSQYTDGCHVFKGCPVAMLPLIWYFCSWILSWSCTWIFFYLRAKFCLAKPIQNKTKYPSTYLCLQNTCKCIIMNKYKLKLQCVPEVCLSLLLLTCCSSRQRLRALNIGLDSMQEYIQNWPKDIYNKNWWQALDLWWTKF